MPDIKTLKKGKTPEQALAIDYFFGKTKGKSAVSDGTLDDMLFDRIKEAGARAKAIAKTGMPEHELSARPPMFFWGFESESAKLSEPFGARLNAGGELRTSVCSLAWLFFGSEQLFVYHLRFDLFSDAKTEKTKDYFYRDITNAGLCAHTTDRIDVTYTAGLFKGKDRIEKTTAEYNSLELTAPGDTFSCSVSGTANADAAIAELKNFLRDKKSA